MEIRTHFRDRRTNLKRTVYTSVQTGFLLTIKFRSTTTISNTVTSYNTTHQKCFASRTTKNLHKSSMKKKKQVTVQLHIQQALIILRKPILILLLARIKSAQGKTWKWSVLTTKNFIVFVGFLVVFR